VSYFRRSGLLILLWYGWLHAALYYCGLGLFTLLWYSWLHAALYYCSLGLLNLLWFGWLHTVSHLRKVRIGLVIYCSQTWLDIVVILTRLPTACRLNQVHKITRSYLSSVFYCAQTRLNLFDYTSVYLISQLLASIQTELLWIRYSLVLSHTLSCLDFNLYWSLSSYSLVYWL
jgi:hypothetical protein